MRTEYWLEYGAVGRNHSKARTQSYYAYECHKWMLSFEICVRVLQNAQTNHTQKIKNSQIIYSYCVGSNKKKR